MLCQENNRSKMRPGRLLLPALSGALLLLTVLGCGFRKDPQLVAEQEMVTAGVEILRTGEAAQRDSVIRSFFRLTHPELLHPFLQDQEPNVRIGMISALGYLKDRGAVPQLTAMLRAESDYLMQETIIYALGEITDTTSLDLMLGLLHDPATNRDLRLSLPITLVSFVGTEGGPKVEEAFVRVLEENAEDVELCSYIAVGILEILSEGNRERFARFLPQLRTLAERRKAEAGEDGIWTNYFLTIQQLEGGGPAAGEPPVSLNQ